MPAAQPNGVEPPPPNLAARPKRDAARARPNQTVPAQPPAAATAEPSCRVLEVLENGSTVQPSAARRVTFEWARRLCAKHPRSGGAPYRLSEAGVVVRCACD